MFEVVFESDDGREFVFGPSGSNWFGMNIGDGMDVTLGTSQGFSQIGATVETQSVGGRTIDVTGQIYGNIVERKNALRRTCPPLIAGKLVFQKTHYMRVYVKAAPSFSTVKNNGLFKMQFYAPFPFFYLQEEQSYYVGDVVAKFRFPVNYAEPHQFGVRETAKYINVMNDGDVRVPFRVRVRANDACANITITNMETLEYLKINGRLAAGDVLDLYRDDSGVFRAELTSGDEVTDVLAWVDEDSKLFELVPGDNLLTASDDGGGYGMTTHFMFNPAVVALYET